MKKLFVVVIGVMLLATLGCSDNFLKHDTVYKTNDHMLYSMFGYQNPDAETKAEQEAQGGWWGDEYDTDGNLVNKW